MGTLRDTIGVQSFSLHKCIANQAKGVIMLKVAFMVGLCLTFFPSSLVLAGTGSNIATVKVEHQPEEKDTSTHQLYANADSDKEVVACTEPRPEVCTQDYRPVCAVMQDGSVKTFSNGCSACSDPAVNGYREGACE